MMVLRYLGAIMVGFGSGLVVAGAVFAFIAIIGVVPRLAQKTKTTNYIMIYEEAIILGGILGALTHIFEVRLPFGSVFAVLYSLCIGVFFGCLAISLTEVLDVIPILTRRGQIHKGMFLFIIAIALGKLFGSLLYFKIPGFYFGI